MTISAVVAMRISGKSCDHIATKLVRRGLVKTLRGVMGWCGVFCMR